MKIKIEKICNKIVLICFGALSFCLTVLSMLETSTETTIEGNRKIIYLSDHPIKHIVVFLAVFLLVYLAGGKLITRQMERIIRQPLPQGMPKLTWVAMGLEDGGEAPGYWNGTSVRIYTENDYDTRKTTQAAAQWSEPTFGSIEISRNRESEKPLPGWIAGIYEENENAWYIELCNLYQTLVYMGTVLYVLTRWKTVRKEELIYAVIVMGGFVFHLFWEGKSQYVMPYFWLLIPYAVMRYEMTGKKLSDISSRYLKNGIYKPGENS